MKLTSKMKGEKSTKNALKLIDEMPKSVKKLVEPTIDMKEIKTIGFGLGLIYFIMFFHVTIYGILCDFIYGYFDFPIIYGKN